MSEEQVFGQPPPRRRIRWVPLAAISVILLIAALAVGGVVLVFGILRSSDVFKLALEELRGDARVVEAIGTPIEPGFLVTGNVRTVNDGGSASLSFSVSGPRGWGTVKTRGARSGGVWKLEWLQFSVGGWQSPLVLVGAGAEKRALPAEQTPTVGRSEDAAWNAKVKSLGFTKLTHASLALRLDGKTAAEVEQLLGAPTEKRRTGFESLKYGAPSSLPGFDEQWMYRRNMGHTLVYFKEGKVVLAVDEWSDW